MAGGRSLSSVIREVSTIEAGASYARGGRTFSAGLDLLDRLVHDPSASRRKEEMSKRTGQIAIAVLGICCVCWGFSFPTMQIGAAAIDRALAANGRAGTVNELAIRGMFNGWRFALAGVF